MDMVKDTIVDLYLGLESEIFVYVYVEQCPC